MQRPTGVTVLAVLAFVGAAGLVLVGLALFAMGGALATMRGSSMGMGFLAGLGAAAGAVVLVIAALYVVTGVGLMKLQNWGRILCLILVALGAASTAFQATRMLMPLQMGMLIWQLILLAIDVWIITYLLKPHVKQAFGVS